MTAPAISRSLARPFPVFHVSPSPLCRRQAPLLTPARPGVPQQQLRHESTRRRLIKKLRLPPAPSFASPSSTQRDHIIFNPPSSAPNVYHTPPSFLPASDPRRKLYAQIQQTPSNTERPSGRSVSSLPPSEDDGSTSTSNLPAPVRKPYTKKYHLTADDVAEMRRLRAEDPVEWPLARLAKHFDCSTFFVSITCKNPAAQKRHDEELEAIKRKWGPRKRKSREDRVKRREAWGRDM